MLNKQNTVQVYLNTNSRLVSIQPSVYATCDSCHLGNTVKAYFLAVASSSNKQRCLSRSLVSQNEASLTENTKRVSSIEMRTAGSILERPTPVAGRLELPKAPIFVRPTSSELVLERVPKAPAGSGNCCGGAATWVFTGTLCLLDDDMAEFKPSWSAMAAFSRAIIWAGVR